MNELADTPNFLFRFRSLDRLLNKGELERQEIYFASPEQLNDPVEGFLDIYWQGDSIVWRNLFKNYLLTLEHAVGLAFAGGPDIKLSMNEIPVFLNPDQLPTDIYKSKIANIYKRFFANTTINKLLTSLEKRNHKVRRRELQLYLRSIHGFSLQLISESNAKYNGEIKEQSTYETNLSNFFTDDFFKALEGVDQEYGKDKADFMFDIAAELNEQMVLLAAVKENDISRQQRHQFVLLEYPEHYLKALESLIYPPWYTSCFMETSTNAAVWGHYGDNHTGVCLKFKTEKNKSGEIGLPLINYITSYSSSRNNESKKNRSEYFSNFKKVDYEPKYPEIDFFKSIGRLSWHILHKHWYSDGKAVSPILKIIKDNEIEWRKNHWKPFLLFNTIKLKEWAYENEYRLIMSSNLSDLKEKEDRTVSYKFSSLEGIIFGMKTPLSAKVQIMKIIKDKCQNEKRTDFKFYQSNYNAQKGIIEISEMKAFTITLDEA